MVACYPAGYWLIDASVQSVSVALQQSRLQIWITDREPHQRDLTLHQL
jgi:hypothetical protein